MKTIRLAGALASAMLLSAFSASAAGLISTNSQGSGQNWNAAIWKTNLADTIFVGPPVAGNTYQLIDNGIAFGATATGGNVPNTKIRNPATAGVQTFAGDSLTMNTNTEIRAKTAGAILNFPGVGGGAGLILNGGVLNAGDNTTFAITGNVAVTAPSFIVPSDNGAGAMLQDRAFNFYAQLSGTAPIIIAQAGTNIPQQVTSSANSFSGGWIVKAGWLRGNMPGSLGNGNILIDPNFPLAFSGGSTLSNGPAQVEFSYNIATPGTLSLSNGGKIILHQDVRFARVFVDGVQIANGTYLYAVAVAAFPNNVAAGGSGSISIGPVPATGLTAVGGDHVVLLSWNGDASAAGNVIKRALVTGGPYTPIATNGAATTFADTTALNGTQYFYVVSAFNDGGTTADSNEATGTPVKAPTIVWVSDNPGALGWTGPVSGTADDVFTTNILAGYNIVRFSSDNSQNVLLTQADIDALNTNDVIILGRSLGSGAFQAPQGHQWNTNITKPIIVQSSFLIRASRLGWFGGESSFNGVPMPLRAVTPTDPETAYLFNLFGVPGLNGDTMAGNYDEPLDANTSQTVDAPVAGARILATGFGTNNVIVEFPAGTAVKAGANILSGYRLYFASGSRELSGIPTAGKDNLTPAGEALFLRAVSLAIHNGVAPNLGDAPVITSQPVGTNACGGFPITLSAAAEGENPLYYQWYFSDGATFTNAVASGTNSVLTIANLQAADTGFYAVVVTNVVGSVTSSVATVAITGTATIASDPADQTNCPGTAVTFTTTASGSGTLTYTWRKGATVLQGPDGNNSYTIASVVLADAGDYSVTVVGDCNTVSNNFTLVVTPAPIITAQPQNQATPMGNGAVFSVTAITTNAGVAPLSYQWQTNGVDVPGATGSSLAISNLALADSGMQVRVAVTNCAGGLLSSTATLTVTPISGISFDFNSPLQFTNAPYYMVYNDWLSSSFNTPPTVFEHPIGGVGPFPGSGALDVIPNNGTVNSALLIPLSFDFSLPGKTLTASAMVKIKNPTSLNRNTQIGFVTSTNVDLDNGAGRTYMTVLLQSTAQPVPTYEIRTGSKVSAANSFIEGNNTAAGTLTLSNWYRLKATFVNNSATAPGTFRVTATLDNMGPLGLDAPTTVATINNVTIANAEIVTARNVFLVVRGIQNTGVENWDNFYASSATGPIAFVQQPASQTTPQGDRVTFRALVDGDGPYTYQWSKNGSPISGATSWKYITPPVTTADNGATFTVAVTGPANSVTSATATLNVTADPLAVVSAGSVDGTTVGVKFNQPVQQSSAENVANYTINGVSPVHARVYRTGLGAGGDDGIYVLLTPASVLSGSFTVVAVPSGVQDLSGGTVGAANSAVGSVAGLTGYDVNPAITGPPGENYSFASGEFIVTGGGVDIWSNADSFRFVYTTKTGDFDVVTKVPYMDVVRGPSKAGLSVRPSLDAFSPEVTAAVNPMWPGRNSPEGVVRQTWNVATTAWGNSPTYNFAWYPDAWLRFRRVGNTFMRYSSTNGVNWLFDGQTTPSPAFPDTLYFGLAVCSVANLNKESVEFQNYGPFSGYAGATIAITSQPTNFTVAAGSSFTDGVVATLTGGGAPAGVGELAYLWQRTNSTSGGWTNLPAAGGTANTIAIGPLFFSDNGARFRVLLQAPGALTVTSAVFTATVTDTAVPTLVSANGVFAMYPVSEVVLNFSENLSSATATDVANYTVTNAAGVRLTVLSATFLNGDPRTVVLTVDGQLGLGNASVGVSGLRDLNNLALATTVRTFRSFRPGTGPVVAEYYQDIGGGNAVSVLTGHATYTASQPSWISYSNLFGVNVAVNASTFPGNNFAAGTVAEDNYGVKAYTYFVPPTTAAYKFWLRGDDGVQLFMNTNVVESTNPVGKVLIAELTAANGNYTVGTAPASSQTNISLVAGQAYYMEVLMKEGGGGDGFSIMWTAPTVNTAPSTTTFIATANLAYPDAVAPATPVISEVYQGYVPALAGNGNLPTLTSATNFPTGGTYVADQANYKYIAGLPDHVAFQKYFAFQPQLGNTRVDNYLGRLLSYFVPPTNGIYKFYMRADDAAQLYMNTNSVDSTSAAGKTLVGRLDAFTSAYTLVAQNISLVGGQRYYFEALWREGGGGDGMAVAVRSQDDASVPPIGPPPEVIPASMLEYPLAYGRAGAVNFTGILAAGTVAEGQTVTLTPAGITGAMMSGAGYGAGQVYGSSAYGFVWLRNGVPVLENSFTNRLAPLTLADNGAVYTLVITNQFSRAERSYTLNVAADTTAPAVVRAVGWRYGDGFTIQFNERLDATSATYLGNYQVNNGLRLVDATLDPSGTMVSFRTSPQTMGTTYTVNINGVKDASAAGNAASTVATFSTWAIGGNGILVELFTNIVGAAIADLTGTPKYVANMPDVVYYTNVFGVGPFGADSGLQNYGARVTAYFIPTNTGYFRFYLRSDDASQLYMNINSSNSEDPAGKVMLIHEPNANVSMQDPRAISPPVSLNIGQRYFMEALFKEGTGGDYMLLTFRATDANGTSLTGNPADTVAELQGRANFGGVPGNPDAIQIVSAPPSDLTVGHNDSVSLRLIASVPPSIAPATTYQWQRFDGTTFTNIPGASGASYDFLAPLSDDGRQIRLLFSAPGRDSIYTTLMHVTADVTEPFIVSVSSLDGNTVGVCFNEPINPDSAGENGNYFFNFDLNFHPLSAAVRPSDPRTVLLTMPPGLPVTGTFVLSAVFIADFATIPNTANSRGTGAVQSLTPLDIGAPPGAGSSWTCTNGSIDVIAGGADIWGTSDQGHFTIGTRTGNFDVWARVDSLSRVPGDNDGITKAGIMVRETLNADARKLTVLGEPPGSAGGRDFYEASQRPTIGAATAAWSGGGATGTGPFGIPNGWIRIKRTGDLFTAYRSSDGVNWVATTTQNMVFPSTVYVGLAATAHIPSPSAGTTLAKFRNVHVPNPPTITVQPSPASQTVAVGSSVSYSVTASFPPDSGTLGYLWRRDGVVIASATGATLNIANAQLTDSGIYTVEVSNDGGSVVSDPVTLTVSATLPAITTGSARYNAGAGTFSASLQTASGITYIIEYKDNLNTVPWTTLPPPIVGDGTVKSFTDPGPLPPMRFYRVRVQ